MNPRSSADIPIYIRPCIDGEIRTEENACLLCFDDGRKYSFASTDKECSDCPSEADCFGGTRMYPKKGYWRSSTDSDTLHKCKIDGICLGGADHLNPYGECLKGYEGRLCTVCEINYSRIGRYECAKCPPELGVTILIIVTIVCALFLFALITLKSNIANADA